MTEIEKIEGIIKEIYKKPLCSEEDLQLASYYIKKWKILTGWKEDTTPVLFNTI